MIWADTPDCHFCGPRSSVTCLIQAISTTSLSTGRAVLSHHLHIAQCDASALKQAHLAMSNGKSYFDCLMAKLLDGKMGGKTGRGRDKGAPTLTMFLAARSRSASWQTMQASLPPSSIWMGIIPACKPQYRQYCMISFAAWYTCPCITHAWTCTSCVLYITMNFDERMLRTGDPDGTPCQGVQNLFCHCWRKEGQLLPYFVKA